MRICILLVLSIVLCASCMKKQVEGLTETVLRVELKESILAFEDLFVRADLIPLETQDSCFIIDIEKVIPYGDGLLIFDPIRPALLAFDKGGRFVKQISRKGDGPGEYQAISDVFINREMGNVCFLSPYGNISTYDMDGQYIGQDLLPTKPNYYAGVLLNDENIALWSCVDVEESGVTVVKKDSMALVYEAWHNDRMLDMGLMKPFYQYDEESFFSSAYQPVVYKIASDSLERAYRWDFGKHNIDAKLLLSYSEIENGFERNNKILTDLDDGVLPFSMERGAQNNIYYYVALRKGVGFNRPWINVFYNKEDGKSFVFEKTSEGIYIRPVVFTDEYVISVLHLEDDVTAYKDVLQKQDYEKILSRKADDNLYLLKFYFN